MLNTGVSLLLGGVVTLVYALYCHVQAVRHRRNGVERHRAAKLDPALLTESGRGYRTRYHLALVLGFLAIVAGLFAVVMSVVGFAML
jgi:hypothetical protein